MSYALINRSDKTIPLIPVLQTEFKTWAGKQSAQVQNWMKVQHFKAEPTTFCAISDAKGKLKQVIVGVGADRDLFALAHLPMVLPEGQYHLEDKLGVLDELMIELGWGLAAYQFTRYKKAKRAPAELVWRKKTDHKQINDLLAATYLVRDLINTPADDMNTPHLAAAAKKVADQFKANYKVLVGDQLLKQNYPTIHAVGRASDHPPRLVDIRWGNPKHKKVTLVGKGVCFDSGGLDIKSAAGMLEMKKDMAGAAHVLGLAYLIMSAKLPVRLRVLIPIVENAVSGRSYHPGDIITTRKGMTVEIGNTDAEGRLILCDALAEAVTEKPTLLMDFATLTGAGRIALGTEVGALFANQDFVAEGLLSVATAQVDPLCRLPLYKPYRPLLNSDIADINNVSASPYGGAITAALFLQEFIPSDVPWAHFDIMACNVSSQPGRPKGGEATGLRASFEFIGSFCK